MKKLISFVILMLLTLNIYGKEIAIPDSEYLISKTMSFSFIIGNATIMFFKDNKYKISYGSEGWYWYNEGTYEFKNGKVFLHPVKCLDHENGPAMDCKDTMGEALCTLNENDDSLYFSQFLKVISKSKRSVFTYDPNKGRNYIEFDIQESKIKEGAKRLIENIPVVVMGFKTGITTDNVKIRKKPSTNSDIVKYQAGLYAEEAQEYDFVPKNTELVIIARTAEKEKVKEWINYWYYVNVGIIDGVWVFGEFIKIN